VTEVKNATL